jgi:hypothetical protein
MKLLGIISVGFDVTDQLLIILFAFITNWKKKIGVQRVHQLFVDFAIRILIEFRVSMN